MFDLKKLDEFSNGNEELKQKFLSIFISQTAEDLEKFKSTIEHKDYEKALYFIHKIHSSIKTVGDKEIKCLVKKIESDLHQKNFSTLEIDAEKILQQGKQLISEASDLLNC